MVDRFIKLLVKWLTARGYHVLTDSEYAALTLDAGDYADLRKRIDDVDKRVDQVAESVNASNANETTAAQIISEWLNGEGAQ